MVQVGGFGLIDYFVVDYCIVYDFWLLWDVFESVGFEVKLFEYCDEQGYFYVEDWEIESGLIYCLL